MVEAGDAPERLRRQRSAASPEALQHGCPPIVGVDTAPWPIPTMAHTPPTPHADLSDSGWWAHTSMCRLAPGVRILEAVDAKVLAKLKLFLWRWYGVGCRKDFHYLHVRGR